MHGLTLSKATAATGATLVLAMAMLLATILPAQAATVTETHQGCDMTANQVTASGGKATASGYVIACSARHTLVMKVQLQIFAGGSWSTTKTNSVSGRGVFGLPTTSATDNCSRFGNNYRTRIVVTVDGGSSWPVPSSGDGTPCRAG